MGVGGRSGGRGQRGGERGWGKSTVALTSRWQDPLADSNVLLTGAWNKSQANL